MELDSTTTILPNTIKRRRVDIQFDKLSYTAGKKEILKSASGKFCSGNLIGILGSSGAGKTTLLNILTGHLQKGVTGQILINGKPRIMKDFHKLASYIMQEDIAQPYLTVMESINVSANLKICSNSSEEGKHTKIKELLSVMGLETCINTRVEKLSGGERKRFLIALELVNDPPVIFLDEPTTGLDDVAMRKCLHVLKSCALQGRTIVTTIHQPSASLIKLFDVLYVLSDGYCIYNGEVEKLVPFLSEAGFPCPISYNPADYIIEIVHFNYSNTLILKEKIYNSERICLGDCKSKEVEYYTTSTDNDPYEQIGFATSFWKQLWILLGRNILQAKRKKVVIAITFLHNLINGIGLGLLFYQAGNDGSRVPDIVKCFYAIIIYFILSYCLLPILNYPFEIKLLEREYFNRWYSLKAYYTALMISLLPMMILPLMVFVISVYFLTEQPLEWNRFLWFTLICLLTAFIAEKMGYAIGTIFRPTQGAIVGSGIILPLTMLAIHDFGHGETVEYYIKILMNFAFQYHSFVAIGVSMFSNRGILDCDDICYFGDTNFAMYKMGWTGKNVYYEVFCLLLFAAVHQIIAYVLLRFRISPQFTAIRNSLKLSTL